MTVAFIYLRESIHSEVIEMPMELGKSRNEQMLDQQVERSLELMHMFHNLNFGIVEGLVERGQTTLIFQEKPSEAEERFRWEIKMVLHNNRWRVETEKQPVLHSSAA